MPPLVPRVCVVVCDSWGVGDAPERHIFGDRLLAGTVAIWVALCVYIIYFDIEAIPWMRWDG